MSKRKKTNGGYKASGSRNGNGDFKKGYDRTGGFYGRYSGKGSENKFFDTTLAFTFDATGEVPATGQLTLIPQGVTESSRVGRKCTIKSVQLRAMVALSPAAAAVSAGVAYLFLVLDTQANGAAAAATGNGGVMTSATFSESMLNLSESGRFRIMKKWVWDFNPGAGATTALNAAVKHLEYYKKCNIPLEFSSTTGAITEIRSNNIFLLAGSDGIGTFDDLISFAGECRVRFSDTG